ncbi:MFS transporter [Streptococcus pseudoporcinus]|uniref:Transporter, major facilitator family protein n=1 Tax=Streptococcus pseudoporcinus LQ 940-04 TaxID=875093 RepID=G5K9V8_9STRE|nr:MFS transporter [Streptococcus pseudoporcinus]EFR44831.1 transporter, major facilitator family protein [Streptococcus pseudoporcinus SPIN 20026]EHI64170.1 transporter, major facilitator family protein [Streptococcus pseudoporcinus LQ 940-04]VEF93481.1 major facilitator superfamily protein [Streptococcus pseudoporcinus]
MKNKYVPTMGALYINYIFQGIATILISQNMTILEGKWQASLSQITLVISAIGLGRVLSVTIAGLISDALGRRNAVLLGVLAYIIFYLGLVFADNYMIAFVFAIFAGIGNSFLDTATYPVVVEAFEEYASNSALSVLNKAFISMGQFLLPLITSFLLRNHFYFGWSFIASALFLAINAFFILTLPFPKTQKNQVNEVNVENELSTERKLSWRRPNFAIEGSCLLIFSLVSVSLFNIFIIWIPSFAESVVGIAKTDSLMFVSLYSIFSFVSVFVTSVIIKHGVHVIPFMIFCTSISALAIIGMLVMPNIYSLVFATFCIGFFAAGGIWQLGLATLLDFFPQRRGLVTSYYSLATSVSVMGSPYITGILAEKRIALVFYLVAALAVLGSIVLLIVAYRYKKVFLSETNLISIH